MIQPYTCPMTIQMMTLPYLFPPISRKNLYITDMRDRMIKNTSDINFFKDRYTTPITVESSSPLKPGDNIIHITAIHCKIFIAVKFLDSTVKLITQDGKRFEQPRYFPTGNEYKNNLLNTAEDLARFKLKK